MDIVLSSNNRGRRRGRGNYGLLADDHWSVGLFDCLSHLDAFLMSWACGVCVLATQKATLDGREGCNIAQDCVPVAFCPLCCATIVRSEMRDRYGIEGSCVSDAIVSCFCSVCAIAQQAQQMQHKGDGPAMMAMDNYD